MRTSAHRMAVYERDRLKDERYQACVSDITQNPSFRRLALFRHHDATILQHSLKVSRFSYRVCAFLGWNAREAARGGLLHDFFLYNWRDRDNPARPTGFHAFTHPRVAAQNAKFHFSITAREENIIIRHMWPLTLTPPRYKEAWVIVVADKLIATQELLNKLRLACASRFGKVISPQVSAP